MKKLLLTLSTFLFVISFHLHSQNPVLVKQISTEGPPMIFLPHIGCSSEMWQDIAADYSKDYSCYLVDFAGFAGQPAIDSAYSEKYTDGMVQFINENHIDNCILVGQNYGAYIATCIAREIPDKISAVIASDFFPKLSMLLGPDLTPAQLATFTNSFKETTISQDSIAFRAYQKQMAEGMNFMDSTKVDAFLKWQLASDRATLAGTLAEQLNGDLLPYLETNSVPTLVMTTWYFAKTYKNMPLAEAENTLISMYPNVNNVSHAITEDAKDFIGSDQPEWFKQKVNEFLISIKQRAGQ